MSLIPLIPLLAPPLAAVTNSNIKFNIINELYLVDYIDYFVSI